MNKELIKLFSLTGRVAVITGGAGMLGTEYAKAILGAGASVALFDVLKSSDLKKRAAELEKAFPGKILALSVDVSNEAGVKKAVASVIKQFKRIDILVNNAALTDFSGKNDRFSPYEKFSTELFRREVDVSLTGSFIVAKAVIGHMMKARSGVMVNIASVYGAVGPDNRIYQKGKYRSPAYAAAKSGIYNFTRAFASYLAPHGVRVNALTLGGVFAGHDKRFTKAYSYRAMLGRMARKEEYQGPMLFLCSDASSYMTGSTLTVDGGWTAW